MPLTRTLSGRGKPRTPQIPQPKTPPSFQPPSHYAAAAGIKYTRPDAQRKGGSGSSSNCGISSSSFFSESHHQSTSVSYPSETDSISGSSLEEPPPPAASQEKSGKNHGKGSERQRRQSLVTELPQMETHLLPSLRDTIDRMTRSPGRPTSPDHPEDEFIQHHKSSMKGTQTTASPATLRSPKSTSDWKTSRSRTPAPIHSPTTPRQECRTPSLLKRPHQRTSHERNEPHFAAKEPIEIASSSNSASKRLSLRSPRTRIQTKATTPSIPLPNGRSAETNQEYNHANGAHSSRLQKLHRRTRSRSDPGTMPLPSKLDRVRYDVDDRPYISNIPRTRRMAPPVDDSDIEQRYEAGIRSQRKLVVTNAIIGPPSSSDSDNDAHRYLTQPQPNTRPVPRSPVGLGFNFPPQESQYGWKPKRAALREPNRHENPNVAPPRPPRSPRYPPVAEARSSPRIRNESVERRAALYQIITGRDPPGHPILDGDESEYQGEDGFAISSSWNRTDGSLEEAQYERHPDHDGGGQQLYRGKPYYQRPTVMRNSQRLEPMARSSKHLSPAFQDGFNSRQHYEPNSSTTSPNHRRRAPSRSPVTASKDPPPLPPALKRHSVYHRSPLAPQSHNLHGDSPNDSDLDGKGGFSRPTDAKTLAALEREAYGIPETNSEDMLLGTNSESDGACVTQAESDSASEKSIYLDEEENSELSIAAESLLKGLDAQTPRHNHETQAIFDPGSWDDYEHGVVVREGRASPPNHPSPPVPAHRSSDATMEAQQLAIEDLHAHQQGYVERLHAFLTLFIVPLRCQNSRRWVSGIPEKVCRLFDWFEDILVLHQQIVGTIEDHQQEENSIVGHLADALHCLVARFEVYQPYLVKHTDVLKLIDDAMANPHDEFGEFMRMQESVFLLQGRGFRQVLLEPIDHLDHVERDYTRLLEATPKISPGYLSLLLLVYSTRTTIRVLNEVRAREAEYVEMKRLLKRIHGIPPNLVRASRERRLLHSGTLALLDPQSVLVVDQLSNSSGSSKTGFSEVSFPSMSAMSTGNDPKRASFLPSLRTPKLIKKTLRRKSSYMKEAPTVDPPPLPDEALMSVFVFNDLLLITALEGDAQSQPLATTQDLVCLPVLGCTHILGVRPVGVDEASQNEPNRGLYELDVIPMDSGSTPSNASTRESVPPQVRTFRLSIPSDGMASSTDPPSNGSNEEILSHRQHHQDRWLPSFEACSRTCLSNLSSKSSNPPNRRNPTGLEPETHMNPTVISLLASGLPFPKSPSFQNQHAEYMKLDDDGEDPEAVKEGEREERGWWSLRFQQVYSELKRADMELRMWGEGGTGVSRRN